MTRLLALARLASATLLNVTPADARAEGGDVLWDDRFGVLEVAAGEAKSGELRWQDDDVDVLAITATMGTVVVVTPAAGADDVMLRAYDGT